MSKPEYRRVPLGPLGGLDKDNELGALGNRSPLTQNVRGTISRYIEKIKGYGKWNANQDPAGSVEIKGGIDYEKWDAITKRLVVGDTTTLKMFSKNKNILTANQSDVETNTTGFLAQGGGGAAIARSTDVFYQGLASLKVTATANSEGGKVDGVTATAVAHNGNLYIKGTATETISLVLRDNTNGTQTAQALTLTGEWQRVNVAHTIGAACTDAEIHFISTSGAQVFYVDAIQLEISSTMNHWTRGGDLGWTTILTSTTELEQDEFWTFAKVNDILICANGKDKPYFWNGLTTAAGSIGGNVWEVATANISTRVNSINCSILNDGYSFGATLVADSHKYDILKNVWSLITSLPLARYKGAGFVTSNDIAYITGGIADGGGVAVKTVYEYNPFNNAYATQTDMDTARKQHAGFAIGAFGYAVTGLDNLQSGERYRPLLNAWDGIGAKTTGMEDGASFAISAEGFIAGGHIAANTDIVEAYATATNTWSTKKSITTARRQLAGSVNSFGGYVSVGEKIAATNEHEFYNYSANSWVDKTVVPASFLQAGPNGFSVNDFIFVLSQSTTYKYHPDNYYEKAQFVTNYKGYLIVSDKNSSRMLYSDLFESQKQRANAFIDLNIDRITAQFEYQGFMYFMGRDYGERLFASVLDPDITIGDQVKETVLHMPGCVSGRSVVISKETKRLYYWSENGPVEWNGNTHKWLGFNRLNRFFKNSTNFALEEHRNIIGIEVKEYGEIWWFMTTTGTSKDVVYIYNYMIDEFYGPCDIPMASVFKIEDLPTDDEYIMGGSYTGYIHRLNNGDNFDGGAIDAKYRTDFLGFGSLIDQKEVGFLNLILKKSGGWNLTVKSYRDFDIAVNDTETISLASS